MRQWIRPQRFKLPSISQRIFRETLDRSLSTNRPGFLPIAFKSEITDSFTVTVQTGIALNCTPDYNFGLPVVKDTLTRVAFAATVFGAACNLVMAKYKILADAVVIVHAAYVGFVVFGFAVILIGVALGWRWIENPWFRGLHLAAIGVVALMALGGIVCPLTTLENYFREKGGEASYPGAFVGHWAHRLIFFQGPPWVFTTCYVILALMVVGLLVLAPPRSRSEDGQS